MISRNYIKPNISPTEIGRFRFYLGIFIGILFSISINLLFNYSRELFRTFGFYNDLLILSKSEFRLFDLFFSSISVTVGFGYTVFIWFSNYRILNRKKNHYKWLIVSNSLLYVFIPILFISRIGSILAVILYSALTYDNDLNFIRDFPIILILSPIVVFLQHWSNIRLILQTRYWILFSAVIMIILILIQFAVIKIDRDKINNKYYQYYKNEIAYVDNEILKAYNKGILIDSITSEKLKKNYVQSTLDLIEKVTAAFKNESVVAADTIVMLKIIIHSQKKDRYIQNMLYMDQNWRYPLPEDIYRQIIKNKNNIIKKECLFEILQEIGKIFTIELDYTQVKWQHMTKYEIRNYMMKRSNFKYTETILSRYIQVCEKLRTDTNFNEFKHYLPYINFDDKKANRQKWIDIELENISNWH